VDERHRLFPRVALGLEVGATALRCRWELRRGGIRRAISFARRGEVAPRGHGARPNDSPDEAQVANDIAAGRRLSAINASVLGHLPGDSRCLIRSLVLLRLLCARGVAAKLVLAVRRESEEAHAWVEVAGIAVSAPAGTEFVRMSEF
jgi:hypothetical protein